MINTENAQKALPVTEHIETVACYFLYFKRKAIRYRPGVAQRVPGS